MAILSKEEAKQILDKAIAYSKADHCEVNLVGSKGGNIRYARNTVSTSGEEENLSLAIESSFGKRSGTATVNEMDAASIEKAVRRSEELARLAPENPEFMEPLGPQNYKESKAFFDATAGINPDYRAEVAAASIVPARKKNLVTAGFFEDSAGFRAKMNKKGLYAYHKSSSLDFTLTVRTEDGTGSGWSSRDFNDVKLFNAAKASEIAIKKAEMSKSARALEPGKYTVILEPAAAIGLLNPMIFGMNARSADEGRSFLSKKGGGTKLGEKIVDERVNIYCDPFDTRIPSATWSGDGQPVDKLSLVENGVVKNLFYDRFWAEKKGVAPVPFPGSVIFQGGNASIEDLIKDTKRGILVTRLWYIRAVDPQTLLYTGLTRDGTFYIENGKIQYPVKNFRFNESPIIMLNNLEALGKAERINGRMIPAMKIRDFTFTSLSDAV